MKKCDKTCYWSDRCGYCCKPEDKHCPLEAGAPHREPLWCEDCEKFECADMGGEGFCREDGLRTWYGNPACSNFSHKEVADNAETVSEMQKHSGV